MKNLVTQQYTTKSMNIHNQVEKLNGMWMKTFNIAFSAHGTDKVSVRSIGSQSFSYETQLEWLSAFAKYFDLKVEKNIYE